MTMTYDDLLLTYDDPNCSYDGELFVTVTFERIEGFGGSAGDVSLLDGATLLANGSELVTITDGLEAATAGLAGVEGLSGIVG